MDWSVIFFPSVFLSFSIFYSRLNFIDRISRLSVLALKRSTFNLKLFLMHLVKSNKAYAVTLWHEILWVLIFAIFSAIRKNKFPQIKITAKFFPRKFTPEVNTVFSNWDWRTLSIVWKYVFLLHVLNKNENIINAGYWVLSENRKN